MESFNENCLLFHTQVVMIDEALVDWIFFASCSKIYPYTCFPLFFSGLGVCNLLVYNKLILFCR